MQTKPGKDSARGWISSSEKAHTRSLHFANESKQPLVDRSTWSIFLDRRVSRWDRKEFLDIFLRGRRQVLLAWVVEHGRIGFKSEVIVFNQRRAIPRTVFDEESEECPAPFRRVGI